MKEVLTGPGPEAPIIRRFDGVCEGIVGMGIVELRVADGGQDLLVYTFRGMAEAAEMMRFLSEFLPEARFLIQPVRH